MNSQAGTSFASYFLEASSVLMVKWFEGPAKW
jgi:hypothetical protein